MKKGGESEDKEEEAVSRCAGWSSAVPAAADLADNPENARDDKRYTLLNERAERKGIYGNEQESKRNGDTELRESREHVFRRRKDPSEHARAMAGESSTDSGRRDRVPS